MILLSTLRANYKDLPLISEESAKKLVEAPDCTSSKYFFPLLRAL